MPVHLYVFQWDICKLVLTTALKKNYTQDQGYNHRCKLKLITWLPATVITHELRPQKALDIQLHYHNIHLFFSWASWLSQYTLCLLNQRFRFRTNPGRWLHEACTTNVCVGLSLPLLTYMCEWFDQDLEILFIFFYYMTVSSNFSSSFCFKTSPKKKI